MNRDLQPIDPLADEENPQQPSFTNQAPGGGATAPDPAMDAYAQQLAQQARNDAAFAPTKAEVQAAAPPAPPPAPVTTTAAPVAAPEPQSQPAPQPVAAPPRQPPPFIAQVSPGGVIPGREVERVGPTGKAAIASTIEANNELAKAASDASIDKQLANQEYQAAAQEQRQALAQQQAQIEKDQVAYRQEADRRQAEIDSDTRRLADMKVDPGRWWRSQDELSLMGRKVGMILGGFAAGYTKGAVKDDSWEKMRAEIADDVRQQEAAYDRLQNTIAAKRTAFGQLVQRYGSPDAARNAMQAIQLRQTALMADSAASKIGTADAKLKAAEIRNKVDAETAQLTASAVAYQMPKAVGPSVSYIDPATGLRLTQEQAFKAGEAEKERQGKLAETHAKDQKGEEALMVRIPTTGEVVRARTDVEARQLSKDAADFDQTRNNLQEAKQLRAKLLSSDPKVSIEDRNQAMKRLKQLEGELITSFRAYGGLGVMSESDKKLAIDSTAQLTSLNPTVPVTDQIEGYYTRAAHKFEAQLRTLPGRANRTPPDLEAPPEGGMKRQ